MPPLGEGGGAESGTDGLAEGLDAVGDGPEFELLSGGGVQLPLLGCQGGVAAVQVFPLALELGQIDDLGQVGIQQPLLLALQLVHSLTDGGLPGVEFLGQPCPPFARASARVSWAGSVSSAHRSAQTSSSSCPAGM